MRIQRNVLGDRKAFFRVLQDRDRLFARHTLEPLQKFIQARASLDVLEQRLYRNARPFKDPRATQFFRITLDRSVYMLSYVPFQPRAIDGIWIAAAAVLVSFLATIYPARSATRIAPAEVLRYE